MSKIALSSNASGTGVFTIASLGTNTNQTLTLPDASGIVFNQGNILGTVTESAGVPTGAIIERGSNANGEYVKYADGTMICTLSVSSSSALTTAMGNVFRTGSNTWTFPVEFSTLSNLTVAGNQGGSPGFAWLGEGSGALSVSTWTWAMFATASNVQVPVASLIAIGRWH
jgi:hypothetical protein